MEKVVSITKVQPLKERSYINGNGDNEIFVSRGFVMTDGIDTFYAEATGEYARQLPAEIDTTVCHSVQLQMNCRAYQDREGQTRYSNEIRIVKMALSITRVEALRGYSMVKRARIRCFSHKLN